MTGLVSKTLSGLAALSNKFWDFGDGDTAPVQVIIGADGQTRSSASNPVPVEIIDPATGLPIVVGATGQGAASTAARTAFSNEDRALLARSGCTANASFTPTNTAYSAGDIFDVAKEFAFTYDDGTAVPAGSLIRVLTTVLKIDQTALQASEAAYTLELYSVTPPSAQADNAAWTLASGDLPSTRGTVSLGTPVDRGSACIVKTPQTVPFDVKLGIGATSLFGELVSAAGFTPTAVARQVLLYGVVL